MDTCKLISNIGNNLGGQRVLGPLVMPDSCADRHAQKNSCRHNGDAYPGWPVHGARLNFTEPGVRSAKEEHDRRYDANGRQCNGYDVADIVFKSSRPSLFDCAHQPEHENAKIQEKDHGKYSQHNSCPVVVQGTEMNKQQGGLLDLN